MNYFARNTLVLLFLFMFTEIAFAKQSINFVIKTVGDKEEVFLAGTERVIRFEREYDGKLYLVDLDFDGVDELINEMEYPAGPNLCVETYSYDAALNEFKLNDLLSFDGSLCNIEIKGRYISSSYRSAAQYQDDILIFNKTVKKYQMYSKDIESGEDENHTYYLRDRYKDGKKSQSFIVIENQNNRGVFNRKPLLISTSSNINIYKDTSLTSGDKLDTKLSKKQVIDILEETDLIFKIIIKKKYFWVKAADTFFTDNLLFIKNKSYLYKIPNKKTKMYLIKGDKVTLLDEKTDDLGQKWYFINYKGKKELNMWIKAEAVDLEPQAEKMEKESQPEPADNPKAKKPEPVTKIPTNKPAEVAQVTLTTPPPKNAEIIKAEKSEPIKSASGSPSFALLASMFSLVVWRLS